MAGLLPAVLLVLVACTSVAGQSVEAVNLDVRFEASVSVESTQQAGGTAPSRGAVCSGAPSTSGYTQWACSSGTAEGSTCSGTCAPGAKAPYGAPQAVCQDGKYTIVRACMAGGIYNFDDITVDGGLPSPFLGLQWQGLRVTNSQNFVACDGRNGYRYGVISGPNVAYSLEVGASDLTNLVRITAPTTESKISVAGFTATAAWQENLRIDVTAYDAANTKLGMQSFTLSFYKPTVIDLRTDPRFSGIYRLTIVASGGAPVSCQTGKQVVIDNLEVYIH